MSFLDQFRRKQQTKQLETIGIRPGMVKEEKAEEPRKKERPSEKARAEKDRPLPTNVTPRSLSLLVRPLVTEKSVRSKANEYVFVVHPSADKQSIKRALMEVYGVHPLKVRTQRRGGKTVRFGRHTGRTADWKKAIITLKEGETLTITETT